MKSEKDRYMLHPICGGENLRNEILDQLRQAKVSFRHFTHEPTPKTSKGASELRNVKLEEGVKALILRGKDSNQNFQFNLPANLKLDMKKVTEIVREKCAFEDPAIILNKYGLLVGSIPPFGYLLGISTFFDEKIQKMSRVHFNCGLLTESIEMAGLDLLDVVRPVLLKFSQS